MATNSFYEEYPIRCPSCGELIACRVPEYKQLLKIYSVEETLNLMEVELYCSRSAFMNPSPVHLSMENRKVIEGLIPPDLINVHPDPVGLGGHPSFSGLTATQLASQTFMVTTTPVITPQLTWTPQVVPGTATRAVTNPRVQRPAKVGSLFASHIRVAPVSQEVSPLPVPPTSVEPHIVRPLIDPNLIKNEMNAFVLPKLVPDAPEEFIVPITPGVPVFNKSSAVIKEIDVGSGYTCQVMLGRTYLAR